MRRHTPLLALVLALGALVAPAVASRQVAPPTASPTITGDVRVDETVTCQPGTWPDATGFTYAWSRPGHAGFDTPGQTLHLTADDVNGYLECQVTATGADGTTATAGSGQVVVGPGRSVITITKVKTGKRGTVLVKGRVGPKALLATPYTRDDEFVNLSRDVTGATMEVSRTPGKIRADGSFTVKGADKRGRRKLHVNYVAFGAAPPWSAVTKTVTVRYSKGGCTGGCNGQTIQIR